jgi:biotin carboxyl carrier protein
MYKVEGPLNAYEIELNSSETGSAVVDGEMVNFDLIEVHDGSFHLILNNKSYNLEVVDFNKKEKTIIVKVNGNNYPLILKDKFDLLLEKMGLEDLATTKISEVKAPMPGLVLDILVEPGNEIEKGDTLLVLEAMKMENSIKSPTEGTVKSVAVEKGIAVEKNTVLIEFE